MSWQLPRAEKFTRILLNIRFGFESIPPHMNFRKTEKGQIVFGILAHWVAERLTGSGLTLPQWAIEHGLFSLVSSYPTQGSDLSVS